jgi:cation diffusion facilitator family transporter
MDEPLADKKSFLEKGEKVAKLSSFTVALLCLTKGLVGFFSGSISLLAQAVDSFTDVFASLTVYVGLKVAGRKPTERFPYGYYRAETFATLIIGVFILVSGVVILWESIMRFLQPKPVSFPYFALSVAVLSIPFLYFLAKYNRNIGEAINSQALVGQSKDYTLDLFSSILVFVGVLSSYLGAPWIEAIVGIIVSIFILKTGVELGKDAVFVLMDAVVRPEHINKIRLLAKEIPGVIGVHDIKIRKSGPFCFGEMHIAVEEGLPVEKAHAITEEIEQKAKHECEALESLIIHMEPAKRKNFRIAISLETDNGLDSTPSSHFGSASYFILVYVSQDQIKHWVVKPNPGAKLSKKRGIITANFLLDEKVSDLLTGELGEGPFHVLKDGFVEVYTLKEELGVRTVIEFFVNDKLEKMLSPKKS